MRITTNGGEQPPFSFPLTASHSSDQRAVWFVGASGTETDAIRERWAIMPAS